MILTTIVILAVIFALIWALVPSVHPKYPPGGSRKPLPLIGDSIQFGTNLFDGFAALHKASVPTLSNVVKGLILGFTL